VDTGASPAAVNTSTYPFCSRYVPLSLADGGRRIFISFKIGAELPRRHRPAATPRYYHGAAVIFFASNATRITFACPCPRFTVSASTFT